MNKFCVSCSHRDQRWRLQDAPFRENYETDYRLHFDRFDGWSASAPNFGCGKSFPTPERAIHALLFENGASFIIITPDDDGFETDVQAERRTHIFGLEG